MELKKKPHEICAQNKLQNSSCNMKAAVCIHPKNPRIFEYRGAPLIFVIVTEHYGAVMNRPFRFERYLEDAAEKRK